MDVHAVDKIPMDWVDRIFECLDLFYQDRWRESFKPGMTHAYSKAAWQSALTGLSEDEIRNALKYYKKLAVLFPNDYPPHQLDFFKVADSLRTKRLRELPSSFKVAREHIDSIKSKFRHVPCRT